MDDNELLRAFVQRRDEQAFAAIVDRYLTVVYNAALRQLRGDVHRADDVTQAVFILLAQKADTIRGGKVLAGWLVTAARLCARTTARDDTRRTRLQSEAAAMSAYATRTQLSPPEQVQSDELHQTLDDAISTLGGIERSAVTLRYLQSKPFKDIAVTLGISEAAAVKRVTRATTKLSAFFRSRGVGFATPALLTDGLLRLQQIAVPQKLASLAVSESLSGTSGVAATLARSAAESGELASKSLKPFVAATAATIALIALVGFFTLNRNSALPRPNASVAGIAPNTATQPKIRVGYYLSEATAIQNDWVSHKPNGYSLKMLQELNDDAFEFIPVVEPGTAEHDDLKQILLTSFPGKSPINAADASALKTLNVLLAGAIWCPSDAVNAIEDAVENGGVGLMTRNQFCFAEPGYTPQVMKIYGLTEGTYGVQTGAAVECDIVEHPILGSRTGRPGQTVLMRPNGIYGIPGPRTTALIKVKNISNVRGSSDAGSDYVFSTVFVSELGKGRVVSCCHSTYDIPKHLSDAIGPAFSRRAVKWLARRPVE